MQVLAFVTLEGDALPADFVAESLVEEERMVWNATKDGVIRRLWARADDKVGAVVLLEVESVSAAERHLRALPSAQRGLVRLQCLELRPFVGFEALFAPR